MSSKKDKSAVNDEKIVIKKYANRRLYNMKTSSYIVLTDVIDLINDGTEFVIEDAKTGEDITRGILNQIIFEQETRPNAFLLPLEFQKQLIRLYNDTYGQMAPDFLTQSISYFTAERGNWQKNMSDMMSQNAEKMMKQSEKLARQNMEMFRKSWDIFGLMQNAEDSAEPNKDETDEKTANGDDDQRSGELEELQNQIDALQSRLKNLK